LLAIKDNQRWSRARAGKVVDVGLDHGVGHPLLLLYDVKVPNGQNSNEFKGLYHYPPKSLGIVSESLFFEEWELTIRRL
jgi:hypothetical protein